MYPTKLKCIELICHINLYIPLLLMGGKDCVVSLNETPALQNLDYIQRTIFL